MKLALGFSGGVLSILLLLALVPRPLSERFSALRDDGLRLAEVYERVNRDLRPIDVAFIGTSHTMNGIDDRGIEDGLAQAGVRANVVNLGVMWMGRDLHLWLTNKLLASKAPKMIVLEINEHEPPYGHPLMPYIASASDMFCCRFWEDFNFPKMFLLFLKEQLFGSISLTWQSTAPAGSAPTSRWEYGWHPLDGMWDSNVLHSLSLGEKLENLMGGDSRSTAYELTSEFGKQTVRQIVDQARSAHVKVMFLYLPEFKYAANPAVNNIRFYSNMAPVIIPPRDLVANPLYWADFAHLNRAGANRLVDYLSTQIAESWPGM